MGLVSLAPPLYAVEFSARDDLELGVVEPTLADDPLDLDCLGWIPGAFAGAE